VHVEAERLLLAQDTVPLRAADALHVALASTMHMAVVVTYDPRLAEAALAAVKQWQYQPILKDGKPVEFKATVTVNFKLA